MTITTSLREHFAPCGGLRAAINLGNPILAHLDAAGQPGGVSVDLSRVLAGQLGVGLELVVLDGAAKSVQAVSQEQADVGFFAIDPLRGESIAFTDAYVLIEGCYVVRNDSTIRNNDQVDRAGVSVMVGRGSAYDLHLTRELKHARLLHAPTSQAVVDNFLKDGADVAAGVKQQLEADIRRLGGLCLLDGRFMVIRQAMGCPKSRGPEAAAFLARFVEEMKASGYVAQALARHGIEGASVAPAD